MKALERINLIEEIANSLYARMDYENILRYCRAAGVNTDKPISSDNRNWLNTQDLLDGEPDAVVLKIADELGIPHTYTVIADKNTVEATFWEAGHFRLFLSHLSTFKEKTETLKAALKRFGISAFVAHVDIEPTKEWQAEIDAGLFSMDALAAILMPGFKESNWTDQEVGK